VAVSLGAFGVAAVTWLLYLWLIPRERVPARPIAHAIGMIVAIGLDLVGLREGGAAAIVSVLSIVLAGYFLYFLAVAKLPPGELAVGVGNPLPAFRAVDDTGERVESSAWARRRVLLKFFSGGW
jgi:hypothetical protein